MGAYLDLDDVTQDHPHARAQLDKLIRERDEAREECEQLRAEILTSMTQQAQLQGEYDERQRDAERYRWLRNKASTEDLFGIEFWLYDTVEEIDAAIDAAMREGK